MNQFNFQNLNPATSPGSKSFTTAPLSLLKSSSPSICVLSVAYDIYLFNHFHYYGVEHTAELGSNLSVSLQITPPAKERLTTPLGFTTPTLFEQWCGFFYIPREPNKWKCCERGPTLFRRYPRLENLTVCTWLSLQRQFFLLSYLKTLSSGPAGVEPATFHSAVERSPNWANQASVIIGWWPGGGDNLNINYASFWLCIIDWSTNVFLLDIFRHKDVDLVIIRENTEGEYSHIEHEVCRIFKLFVKLLWSTCTVNSI